ncbi:MAG: DUF3822 family protein [Leadbetterella sp.]|nr:DUF3822 family protein [Leadbetterella sp.]
MNNCFRITDDRFSAEHTDLYDLTFEVQFTRLRFVVRSGGQLIGLEDHFLGYSNDISTCERAITALLETHPILSIRFWKTVKLISDLQIHTLVPSAQFKAENAPKYLELTFPTADMQELELVTETIHHQTLVSGTVRSVNTIFRDRYPDLTLTSALAVGLNHFSRLDTAVTMGVISETFFDLYYLNTKNKMRMVIKSPLRNLAQLTGPDLLLYGEITPYSRSYHQLKSQFRSLVLGEITEALPEKFSELPPQRYFTLLAGS